MRVQLGDEPARLFRRIFAASRPVRKARRRGKIRGVVIQHGKECPGALAGFAHDLNM
jgi:hypothetical protein